MKIYINIVTQFIYGMIFQSYWRTKLSQKIRNSRRRESCQLPEVMAKKTAVKASNSITPSKRKSHPPAYGMPNYLPAENPVEDHASLTRHRDFMIKENKKKMADHVAVGISMVQTFESRRTFIVNESPSLTRVKELYPCLFDAFQVIIQIAVYINHTLSY
jgi:hypothetical protein